MKTHTNQRLLPGLARLLGGFALFTGALHAAPFLYSPGDLVLAFRQTGNDSDYVVNLGKATNYNTLPAGTTVAVANLSAAQLNSAFPSLNGLKWSVAGANRPPVDPNYPLQTIWASAPRLDSAVQSPAWLRKGQFVQGTGASQIDAVGVNAASSSSSQPAGPNNTATGVVIPVNSDFAFSPLIGDAGDFVGTFQGDVENRTADDFDGAPGNVSRSDLYELLPGTTVAQTLNTPGRFLGYFELKPDGTLTFNTGSPAIHVPKIASVTRDGDVTTVSFATVSGTNYTLRFTDAAGLGSPITTWVAGPSLSGNGSVQSLQDTSTDAVRFFALEVLR
jgi:hypothetical protein